MTTYVAMLRGINVGGKKVVKMDALRAAASAAGLKKVRTYVQSGNVVFERGKRNTESVEGDIRNLVKKGFGFDVTVVVRTKEQLESAVAFLPFVDEDPEKLHVTFLSDEPASVPAERLEGAKGRTEEFAVRGREVYLYCPDGYGRTKLSNAFLERVLGVPATTRNWRTVNALLAMTKS